MGAIPDQWPVIDKMKFAESDDNIYSDFDTEFKDEVNKVIDEGASAHTIGCEEARQGIIKRHPKVFADKLNGNAMKMEPVSVKFKPDAVKPKDAYTAREPPEHWRPAAKKLIDELLKDGIIQEVDDVTEFCSRARFLPKDNNVDLHLITDFRGINGMFLCPVYPLSLIHISEPTRRS